MRKWGVLTFLCLLVEGAFFGAGWVVGAMRADSQFVFSWVRQECLPRLKTDSESALMGTNHADHHIFKPIPPIVG